MARRHVAQAMDRKILDLAVGYPARISRVQQSVLGTLEPRLTFRQFRTLQRVANGYTMLSQLASRGNLSLPAVSENVDGLVKRGLMTTTQSTEDRRAIVLGVTEAGRAAVEQAEAALQDLVGYLMADIPPDERQVLVNALQRMYDRATEYFAETGDRDS